jgi:hypothetical protein
MTSQTLPRRRFVLVVAGLSLSAFLGCRPHAPRPVPSPSARAPTPQLTRPPQSPSPARTRFGVDVLLDNPAVLRHQRARADAAQTWQVTFTCCGDC